MTNGIYATGWRDGNRVKVDKPLSLQSVHGPQFTIIEGGRYVGRCVYLTSDASLSGFTLRDGYLNSGSGPVYGAGALGVAPARCTLNNCTLIGNQPTGVVYGGGAAYCTLNNCTLTGNSVPLHQRRE